MTDIAIAVAYHKKAELIRGENLLPMHVGRAIPNRDSLWLTEHTIGDDTGDSISEKNKTYNELTAVYWMWKNLSANWYGLMHYRRFFRFYGEKNSYYLPQGKGDIAEDIGYSPELLRDILRSYDFIAPKPIHKSVFTHYKKAHDISDLIEAGNVISEEFPDFYSSFQQYIFGSDSYFYNMFVLPKNDFFRYSAFIFGVLGRLEDRFKNKRMYLSERLTGTFITKLLSEGKRGKFLPVAFTEEKPGIKNALSQTGSNLKHFSMENGLLYTFKPLLTEFLPSSLFRMYRNRR